MGYRASGDENMTRRKALKENNQLKQNKTKNKQMKMMEWYLTRGMGVYFFIWLARFYEHGS